MRPALEGKDDSSLEPIQFAEPVGHSGVVIAGDTGRPSYGCVFFLFTTVSFVLGVATSLI